MPGNIVFEANMFVQMTQEACIIVFLYCPQLISVRQYHFGLNCAMKHEAFFSWLESQSNYLLGSVCVCVCVHAMD